MSAIAIPTLVILVFALACMMGDLSATEEERYGVAQVTSEQFPDWDRLYRPWWDGMSDQGRREVFAFCGWYGDARSETQLSYFGGSFEKTINASLSCFWIDHNRSWLVGEQSDLLGN